MCTVHPSATVLSWVWGGLVLSQSVLLTFGTGHCICTGHTAQPKWVPGAGSLQGRAVVSGASGHSLTCGGPPELLVGIASFTKSSGISRTSQHWAEWPATLPVWLPRLPTGAAWFQPALDSLGGPALTEHTAGLALCLGCTQETQGLGSACRATGPAGIQPEGKTKASSPKPEGSVGTAPSVRCDHINAKCRVEATAKAFEVRPGTARACSCHPVPDAPGGEDGAAGLLPTDGGGGGRTCHAA